MTRTSDYQINKSIFRVTYGSITELHADAIVSSDDNHLSMGGGVSLAILRAGGEVIRKEARKHIPLALGDVAVTSAGDLPAKYVFHAVTIDYDKFIYANRESVREATLKCLQLADQLGVRQIAFPALGTGTANFPFQLAADVMVRSIADYLSGDTQIERVTLALFSRERVTTDDLNIFYERATSLASLSAQARRLGQLMSDLKQVVGRFGDPALSRRVEDLYTALDTAQHRLQATPDSVEMLEEIQDQSELIALSRQVLDTTAEAQDYPEWSGQQEEAKILRTKLQGLQSILNIQISNLNRHTIEEAKYGGIGVPPRLANAISDSIKEIEESESRIRDLKLELAAFGEAAV